jgi:CBS domain-containing protein
MKARDVMTTPPISVDPATPVTAIAALLYERHISAVPVVEGGRLVGIVSEADLLHRREIGTDLAEGEPWWQRLFGADASPAHYVKSHGGRARDVMTREVLTVAPDVSIAQIATLLEARGIKRVPVLDRGRLVGIVSRSDLVRALAATAPAGKADGALSDEEILQRLTAELGRRGWWRAITSNVTVLDGVVEFTGLVDSEEEREAARVAAETIPGVRRVEDRRYLMRDLSSMV